ncbi:MAG: ATP-dependent 6-phosphofructokinase [Acidobacteriota bacterium]|nr:ATP-dependent 6-phosphofructokinase [Acidobacteriota bacterium]MDE2923231.1 ATP-dependent 6-phosphofructokinase [Acidobacteriota bacterium]MDE3266092.1 ATP-dependent 6-phosphofructokinase [Acidobacteriota bacterium]
MKRIGISTGGGDAPGLNAVIRAVTLASIRRGWEVVGLLRGYGAFFDPNQIRILDRPAVRGTTHLGGTILGTRSGAYPFERRVEQDDGSVVVEDVTEEAVEGFHRLGLDALVAVGGDGSMRLALKLHQHGIPVVGVPKTIDNDLAGTNVTFGFHTAVDVATAAIERLHSTAEAHDRIFVVELMGRYAGWIALFAGVAATAQVILIPEIPYDIEEVCDHLMARERRGRHWAVVVAAEGARPVGGDFTWSKRIGGQTESLGGVAERVATQIHERTGKETRTVTLGHLQRGGQPIPYDRLIALRFGAAAVRQIEEGEFGVMVSLDPPTVRAVPLELAVSRMKSVPLEADVVATARDLGICLGE